MIAFGSSVTEPAVYRRCAEVGIERAAEREIQALRSHPLRGARAWAGSRLHRGGGS